MPTISPLATLTPPSSTRTWLSSPHPNLPIVATACSDKTVRIYSLTNFSLQSTVSGGHKRSIRSVAWKPGSGPGGPGKSGIGESILATGSFDASAGIWKRYEGTSGKMTNVDDEDEVDFTRQRGEDSEGDEEWRFAVILDGHDSEIKSLAFSTTSPLLATCSRDKSVWIWEDVDDDNFETVAVLQEHEGDVKCVAWHPDEELLASASYDDTIRLWKEDDDDWGCCARLDGHDGTVWWVEFEDVRRSGLSSQTEGLSEQQRALLEEREASGPRLVSSSDDVTIRIWRRTPQEKKQKPSGPRIPSIIKSTSNEEHWFEEAKLPQTHERAIYAVSWSKSTGRIVSTGSDGKIVVYEERWLDSGSQANGKTDANGNVTMEHGGQLTDSGSASLSHWVVIAEYENAHDVFEINHVCWAKRADKGKRDDSEEIIVSTGDDGEVKVWTLDP
ncbi:Cytosolic iron-sulfur protein assembly protein [Taxawa tesnikishii (nom. ined.)]|nr:Cytosolic iron-sulfur protein assembly protein [Dothideales sp. JES 119]